jgi:tRNA 2-thiouridine synthesizing protein E
MDIVTDKEGYLTEPEDWSTAVADELAKREGIELTNEHWEVINYMRDYLHQHRIAPDVRHVMKHLKDTIGAGRNRVFELFPYGYVQQACKIAGMKRPRAWSTG